MDNIKNDRFDLNALAEDVANRPAPQGCEEIARLFTNLPLWSSFINTSPKHEQKRAFALLKEKEVSPTAEEILFMADIACGKYHRIRRDRECGFSNFESEKAHELYRQYYDLTGNEEIKYILDNFESFTKLCLHNLFERQRDDDLAPYKQNSTPSTSRDPDSDEWKK